MVRLAYLRYPGPYGVFPGGAAHATEVSLLKHRYPPMQVLLEAGVDPAQPDSRGKLVYRYLLVRIT